MSTTHDIKTLKRIRGSNNSVTYSEGAVPGDLFCIVYDDYPRNRTTKRLRRLFRMPLGRVLTVYRNGGQYLGNFTIQRNYKIGELSEGTVTRLVREWLEKEGK